MQYPICLHVKLYRGSNPEKKIRWQTEVRTANKIADWINTQLSDLADGTVHEFDYDEIANSLGIDKDDVNHILFANGGGSNGITLRK